MWKWVIFILIVAAVTGSAGVNYGKTRGFADGLKAGLSTAKHTALASEQMQIWAQIVDRWPADTIMCFYKNTDGASVSQAADSGTRLCPDLWIPNRPKHVDDHHS